MSPPGRGPRSGGIAAAQAEAVSCASIRDEVGLRPETGMHAIDGSSTTATGPNRERLSHPRAHSERNRPGPLPLSRDCGVRGID